MWRYSARKRLGRVDACRPAGGRICRKHSRTTHHGHRDAKRARIEDSDVLQADQGAQDLHHREDADEADQRADHREPRRLVTMSRTTAAAVAPSDIRIPISRTRWLSV